MSFPRPTIPRGPVAIPSDWKEHLSGLLWHAGAFVIINAFVWILDITLGPSGLDRASWVTGVWGFALAFHALAYLIEGRGFEERKSQQYVEEARRRGAA